MRQLLTFLTLCFLSLPALADSPSANSPSAMITSLDGSALVITADQKVAGAPLMTLAPHTMVELKAGATMSIVFFSGGVHERYTGPVLVGIGKNRSKIFKGEETARQVVTTGSALIKAIDPNALAEGPSSGGVTVTEQEDKTRFTWQGTTPGPYMLTIFQPAHDGKARRNMWSEELAKTSVVYDGPALEDLVTYVAEVQVGEKQIAGTQFRIADNTAEILGAAKVEADAMSAANPGDTTSQVLMHTLYAQAGDNESAVTSLYPSSGGVPEEAAFINRMNVMGKAVNATANKDTAEAQGYYAAEDAWVYSPFWNADSWGWDGWDNI